MKNKLVISTVALSILSSVSTFILAADNVMVVTANRIEQDINDTLAAVEVITRDDIDRIQPQSITDLLTTISGLDFAHSGGAGQESSLFTRGTNSDHTLILIDGVRVGSATSGKKSFTSIPVAQIERIEVVKGPRAALWGSDAIGGVIQIFTRKMNVGELASELTIGSNDHIGGNVVFGFGSEKISNTVTVSYEDNDGYDVYDDSSEFGPDSEPDNDGYRNMLAVIRGNYQLSDELLLDWVAQIDKGNNEYDGDYLGNETDYDNYFWNIRYSYSVEKWLTQFSVSQSRDEILSYGQHFNWAVNELQIIPKSQGSLYATTRDQANLLTNYKVNDILNFTGGIDWYKDDVADSTRFIADDFDPSSEFGNPEIGYPEISQTTQSVFVSSSINTNKIIGELAVRRDRVDSFESNRTFNVSLGYKILDNITFSANRSKGFKAPTFNNLFYPVTPYYAGNPELQAEESYNTEYLLKGHFANQSIMLVNYENNVSNLIGYETDQFFVTKPINVNSALLKGNEIVYQYRGQFFTHKLSTSYVRAIDLSIDPITNEARRTQLQRRAKKHASYEVSADWGSFSFFTQFNYTGERPDKDFSTFPAQDINLDSFTQINFGASYQLDNNWKFKLKINDVTDKAPASVVNYNPAGEQFFFSVQYSNF